MFAFPYGGLAAFTAGVAHALLAPRVKSRALVVIAVALVGVIAQWVQMLVPWGFIRLVFSRDELLLLSGPPVASAVPISLFLLWRSRRMPKSAKTSDKPGASHVDAP